jgi:thiol-disulfide isomerase/thioredoxin
MKVQIILLASLFFYTSFSSYSESQTIPYDTVKPTIGKAMPNFELAKITHYNRTNASLKDFKGKWLILDFWFPGCTSCVQSFPKVSEIQKEFKKELTWMMIGLNDHKYNKGIEQFYEKMRAKRNLDMPVAYDSSLVAKWNIHAMPYIIIIDPNGIVRFITDGRNITKERIQKLLIGENVSFYLIDVDKSKYDSANMPLKLPMESANLLYRSAVTKWNGEDQWWIEIDRWAKWPEEELKKGYKLTMAPLVALYYYAYVGRMSWTVEQDSLYGKFYPKPLLEVSDSTLFEYSFGTGDRGNITGMYNYYILVPHSEATSAKIAKLMREDLKRVFKYEVSIETRNMPVWKLVEIKTGAAKKIETKGGTQFATPGTHAAGYSIVNYPAKYLLATVTFYIADSNHPFIDETGVTGNIDFTLKADMTNILDVKKELQKQGFDLVKGVKEMKVLVLRDGYKNE